jgi:hypothetical protein
MSIEQFKDVHIYAPRIEDAKGVEQSIIRAVKGAVERTSKRIPLHEVSIHVTHDPKRVIPGYGHGGWTYSSSEIDISVDNAFARKKEFIEGELPRSVSHELHHAVRSNIFPNEERTLGAALVREGLATLFEQEVWGGNLSDWAQALNQDQIDQLMPLYKKEFAHKSYDHPRWFFGRGDLPNWAGYTLGVYIIKKYLQNHPNESAGSLVGVPWQEFV